MAVEGKKKVGSHWWSRLRFKYRLVILNDETFEEKFSFRLSRLNVFVALGSISIFFFFLLIFIIAFTPLREYIPGYASVTTKADVYELQLKADSLETAMSDKDLYIYNIKRLIEGREIVDELPRKPDSTVTYGDISLKTSREDSLLRAEVESQESYAVADEGSGTAITRSVLHSFFFFSPVKGVITNGFNPANQHFGIDVVARKNEAVKAALDGRIVFADWTLETGYTIGIQHQQNIMTVYKHNASLLKKAGAYVKAGEAVAIIGNTGEMSTGPHLHFELWYNGSPVNPRDYVSF